MHTFRSTIATKKNRVYILSDADLFSTSEILTAAILLMIVGN